MPSERSSAAILAVVRRVHLSPVMGSPAVSGHRCGRGSRAFFFRGLAPAAGAAHAVGGDIALDELAPSAGDGGHIEAEQRGDSRVAAPAALQGLQPGEQKEAGE